MGCPKVLNTHMTNPCRIVKNIAGGAQAMADGVVKPAGLEN